VGVQPEIWTANVAGQDPEKEGGYLDLLEPNAAEWLMYLIISPQKANTIDHSHIHDHAGQEHEIIPFIITTTSSCVEDERSISPRENNDSFKEWLSDSLKIPWRNEFLMDT